MSMLPTSGPVDGFEDWDWPGLPEPGSVFDDGPDGDQPEPPTPVVLAAVPTYPTVPGPLGDLIHHRGGLPAALIGGAGLAAAAAVTTDARLHISDTWTETPTLWVVPMAPRGAGKTPAMTIAFAPVRDLDDVEHHRHQAALTTWTAQPAKDRGTRPTPRTRLTGDITLEALVRVLDTARGAHTIAADELSMVLRGLGEYKTGGSGDRGRLLSLWSAQPWRYQRVGGGTDIYIPCPIVTIAGTLQPALHGLLGGDEDGLRPRWLPHLASLNQAGMDAGGLATHSALWDRTLRRLHGLHSRREWVLSGPAATAWNTARSRWKRESSGGPHGPETASTSAALGKADIHAARVALVLAELGNPGAGGPIPLTAMTAAVDIVDFTLDSWRALGEAGTLGLSRRDIALDSGVDRLLAYLDEHGGKASRRELLRARVAGCRTAEDLDALLRRWEATYPLTVELEQPKMGRPSVIIYAPTRLRTFVTKIGGDKLREPHA